jgi:hypothetical protein
MEFVIGCCKVARASNDVMDSLFIKLNKELRRSRLNGWKLWSEFCTQHNIKPAKLKTMDNLVTTYADFVVHMAKKGVSEHLKAAARPAVQQLLDMLERNINLTTNSFIANIVRVNSAKIHKGPRYTTIWPLQQLLGHIVKRRCPIGLSWKEQMGITAAVFMVFVPCRPIALIRINPATATEHPSAEALTVMSREKTDFGRGQTVLLLRDDEVEILSPRFWFNFLHNKALQRGITNALFVSETGQVYTRSDSIGMALKQLLADAGIPGIYLPYSIGHALITYLYELGYSEIQVNAYTGHSPNYHTIIRFYYHLDKNAVGKKITGLIPIPEKAMRSILADQEGEEEDQDGQVE